MDLVKAFTEVETGKGSDAEPPAAARRHRGQVLVAKLDRLSRDVHLIAQPCCTELTCRRSYSR